MVSLEQGIFNSGRSRPRCGIIVDNDWILSIQASIHIAKEEKRKEITYFEMIAKTVYRIIAQTTGLLLEDGIPNRQRRSVLVVKETSFAAKIDKIKAIHRQGPLILKNKASIGL